MCQIVIQKALKIKNYWNAFSLGIKIKTVITFDICREFGPTSDDISFQLNRFCRFGGARQLKHYHVTFGRRLKMT